MDGLDVIEVADECWLWRAVLKLALDDAKNINPVEGTKSTGGRPTVSERDDARRWCLSPLQPWRGDRRFVISLCGYDVDVIEARIRQILNPTIAEEREREAEHVESDEERTERMALATHIELGGSLDKRANLRRPKVQEAMALAAE